MTVADHLRAVARHRRRRDLFQGLADQANGCMLEAVTRAREGGASEESIVRALVTPSRDARVKRAVRDVRAAIGATS
jgi:hypothetical protein